MATEKDLGCLVTIPEWAYDPADHIDECTCASDEERTGAYIVRVIEGEFLAIHEACGLKVDIDCFEVEGLVIQCNIRREAEVPVFEHPHVYSVLTLDEEKQLTMNGAFLKRMQK